MIRVASLFTAGTNCDEETMLAFEMAGAKSERVHLNLLKKNRRLLEKYQILAIPGGFTYGDYISAGKILANELQYILEHSITEFIQAGKLIIGICNGFQVLVKAGILPGFSQKQSVTLDVNDSNRFECRWVYLKANPKSPCVFTKDIDMMPVPVAHAEGKFVVDSEKTLKKIKKNNQDVFTYVNQKGGKAQYPDNPNGSIEDIAGICDSTGRIFGLMPHPERASSIYQYPDWFMSKHMQEPIGLKVFKNAVKYAQKNL
ncbi:MAG: phosphoribosylformylglycinamidine synthase I [Candidatus Latescibacteria bacterium]|nr:phosphoribosylformylglycinamidine synthase I [Candidatus Latescibacterota bacterium]